MNEQYVKLDSGEVIRRQSMVLSRSTSLVSLASSSAPPIPPTPSPSSYKQQVSKSYECYLCRDPIRSYMRFQNLQQHMRQCHTIKPRTPVFDCSQCDMKFNQIAYLWRHVSSSHGDSMHSLMRKCEICGKEVQRQSIQMHMRVHNGERPFKCEKCDRAFTSPSNLRFHLWQHSETKQYYCNICDKSFIRIG